MKKKTLLSNKENGKENLARMVAKGFEGMDKKFENIDKKFDGIDKKFESLEGRMDGFERRITQKIGNLERRIDDVVMNRATKDDVYALTLRVDHLEIVTGLKNNKK